jgi:predicted  nucleic acid-binding Zn-ribbon protein
MQNEHDAGDQPPVERGQSGTFESPEWSEFQRELETLGRQLSELRGHTAALGDHLVQGLEAQYHEVKARADLWKRATERQVDEAQGAYSDLQARSREAVRQMWERSEPLRQGARDVGEGLVSAWAELRASFGKAAGRLSSEPPHSTSIRPADDHRDSS